jgi:antitoxin HigA-1
MNTDTIFKVHPGRVLLEEFLAPEGVSVWHLARDIGVGAQRIYEIIEGQRPITADIAHRLAHYFGVSERYWLDLQARYDGNRKGKLPGKRTKAGLTPLQLQPAIYESRDHLLSADTCCLHRGNFTVKSADTQ